MDIIVTLGSIAGALLSVGVIWTKGVIPLIRAGKKIEDMYQRIESLPEWCATVDESLKQLHPNGGRSLKDRVEQTHRMMSEHLADHDRNHEGVS